MTNTTRKGWIAFLAGLTIACVCVCVCSGVFIFTMTLSQRLTNSGAPLSAPRTDVAGAARTPTPASSRNDRRGASPTQPAGTSTPFSATPSPSQAQQLDAIQNVVLPKEDLAELAVRFKGIAPAAARVACPVEAKGYEVGDTRSFTLSNQDDNSQFKIEAELRYKTDNVYMWVEVSPNSVSVNRNDLRRAGDAFDSRILATNRAFFGEEARPGVDCDPRLYILHATGIGSTVGGYFSSPDGYPRSVRPDSNEAEMFVVNAEPGYNGADPGSRSYMSTLAHELQHMISANQVHAPALWLEEGASQLAERLNGYSDEVATVYSYANSPETQLNTWSESSAGENSAHYGGAYLFWAYLYDRFGDSVVKAVARAPERSIPGMMRALDEAGVVNPDTGKPYEFADLFADFVVANYLGRQKVDGDSSNRYNYTDTDIPPMSIQEDLNSADFPYQKSAEVGQFGTHYLELRSNAPLQIEFKGSSMVPLLPTGDAQGYFWWSNRADASNPRLTRDLDLTGVKEATLTYRAWYRIERDYDYAYVSVSTDGGKTWTIQNSTSCSTSNPNGSNLGCGYTGASGRPDAPAWVDERVDLNAYAGRKIQLRFEMVNDAGVNREGLAIDNIRIPQIGFRDEVSSANGWRAEGFVRMGDPSSSTPNLPQSWRVQLIVFEDDGTVRLQRVPLSATNTATVRLALGRNSAARRAVLAISGATPVTTEPAKYQLSITRAE